MNTLIKIICFLKGHSWLSVNWKRRRCNRCGKAQVKGAITGYQWKDFENVVKDFNPCK